MFGFGKKKQKEEGKYDSVIAALMGAHHIRMMTLVNTKEFEDMAYHVTKIDINININQSQGKYSFNYESDLPIEKIEHLYRYYTARGFDVQVLHMKDNITLGVWW